MPDFSMAALSGATTDPRDLHKRLVAGRPAEISNLAAAFATAAHDFQYARELRAQSARQVKLSRGPDPGTPVDYQGEAELVAQTASDQTLLQIAKRLDIVAEDLSAKTAAATAAVDTLAGELALIEAEYGSLAATAGVTDEQLRMYAADQLSRGRCLLVRCVTRVGDLIDQYQHNLRSSQALLRELGFVEPANLDEGPGDTTETGLVLPVAGASAAAVAAWWAKTSAGEKQQLIATRWKELAQLRGLPTPVANQVNRKKLRVDRAALKSQAAAVSATVTTTKQTYSYSSNSATAQADQDNYQQKLLELNNKLATLKQKLANAEATEATLAKNPAGLLMRYDSWGTAGEGVAVVAVGGNPDTADNVAVNVPGTDNSVTDDGTVQLSRQARTSAALQHQMDQSAPDEQNVVILYQGYQSPDGVANAVSDSYAKKGALALSADLDALSSAQAAAGSDPHTTLIAHSYGTVTAAAALRAGAKVDDYVAVGSPGMQVGNVDELGMDGSDVWVGAAPGDPVTGAGGIYNQDPGGYSVVDAAGLGITWLNDAVAGPTFDSDPTDNAQMQDSANPNAPQAPEFGAKVFSTQGSVGHGGYFRGQSLVNIANIATGNDDQVDVVADNSN